ncbi:O-antigen ligase family protein [Bengtsoniella intestinalis]|uniref:O-antigen ligase family protein n=1 Tax=Bengtsoniella intestinalis TaxID=3073143 RepID=UPI00391F9820
MKTQSHAQWKQPLAVVALFVTLGYGITLFLSDGIHTKVFTLLLVLVALMVTVLWRKKIHCSPMLWVLFHSYILFLGVTTLYASAKSIALTEYLVVLVGAAFFLLFVAFSGSDTALIWGGVGLVTAVAFLSVEGATLHWLSPLLERFISGTEVAAMSYYDGERLFSFWGNPNVFTTILGIGLFLTDSLFLSHKQGKRRYVLAIALVLQAYVLFLSMSLAGLACFGLSVLLFLLFLPKGSRFPHVLHLLFIALLAFFAFLVTGGSFVGSYTNRQVSGSPLPLALVVLLGILLAILDPLTWHYGRRWQKKVIPFTVSGLAVLLLYLLVGFQWTQTATLEQGGRLNRILYLEPGDYDLTVHLSDASPPMVLDMVLEDMGSLLDGDTGQTQSFTLEDGDTISFTVTQEVVQVNFLLSAAQAEGAWLEAITYTDGVSEGSIPTEYVLFPESMVSRLQGLTTNDSVLIRWEQMKNAWTLFLEKPLLGYGLGGFDSQVQRVQTFRYVSTQPHSHFAKMLVEGGLVGFGLYISLLTCAAYLLIRGRDRPLAPYLWGGLMMIVLHGGTELSISQCSGFAFMVFILALIARQTKQPLGKIQTLLPMGYALFFTLLCGNTYAQYRVNTQTQDAALMVENAKIDFYQGDNYKISYALGYAYTGDTTMAEQAEIYLAELEQTPSNSLLHQLFTYYLVQGDYPQAERYAQAYLSAAPLNGDHWEAVLQTYMTTVGLSDFYDDRDNCTAWVEHILTQLDSQNQMAISPVTLNQTLLTQVAVFRYGGTLADWNAFATYLQGGSYD